MNQINIYWKHHILFFMLIVIILSAMFPIQLFLGAQYYTTSGFHDQPWYNLINTTNFILLHVFLLISVTVWVVWSGWKKAFINSAIGLINAVILTIIIFFVVQMDWLYNCMDFCGFGTVFIMPFVLLTAFCISLFFPATR